MWLENASVRNNNLMFIILQGKIVMIFEIVIVIVRIERKIIAAVVQLKE